MKFLDGIAVGFYCGIGAEVQTIAPFQKMNFFIGINNAGKSIILNVLSKKISGILNGSAEEFFLKGVEQYRGEKTGNFTLNIGCDEQKVLEKIYKYYEGKISDNNFLENVRKIINYESRDGILWIYNKNGKWVLNSEEKINEYLEWPVEWRSIWYNLTGMMGGGPRLWVSDSLEKIASYCIPRLPNIYLIPAKRQMGERGDDFKDLSGKGLIDHLAMLQNPSHDRQDRKAQFKRINNFVQEVTGKPDAELEVPSEREHLLVHMDNKVLPLSSLGTGIHEVVLIAAFCTIHNEVIMCIEEPEIHLHPMLQRKLIYYLMNKTNNQYFIATHSSVFIDAPNSSIFRVTNDGVQTYVKSVLTKNEQREILDELGCRASDILQSNAVIWVEGPSDRIYLKHWMKAVDPELTEGIHYTIMFYGGALIKHLTASDDALEDFIKLRQLNRNMAIVIDSDREVATDPLKPQAARLETEMNKGNGIAWVTDGREVENYVDGEKLQAALEKLHPRLYQKAAKTGKYDHAFYFYRDDPDKPGRNKIYKDGDKVGAAEIICREPANLDILDLRKRVEVLVEMVQKANGVIE